MVAQKVFTRGKARRELGPRTLIYVDAMASSVRTFRRA